MSTGEMPTVVQATLENSGRKQESFEMSIFFSSPAPPPPPLLALPLLKGLAGLNERKEKKREWPLI